jgi:hypothetical protein
MSRSTTGVLHGFLNDHYPHELPTFFRIMNKLPESPYDEDAAGDAHSRIIDFFFSKHLGDQTEATSHAAAPQ